MSLLRAPALTLLALMIPLSATAGLSPFIVSSSQKISDTAGYLSGPGSPGTNPGGVLAQGDFFGTSIEPIGDIDDDGVIDLAVGAALDDTGGTWTGAVYILQMNPDGTVKARTKLSASSGGLDTALSAKGYSITGSQFGAAVALLGDLDGPGGSDFTLAVGAFTDDSGGNARGAVYVLFMDASPVQVLSVQKISDDAGGLSGPGDPGGLLANSDVFGAGLAVVGDLDADGNPELAVGAQLDDSGGANAGALYVLFLDAAGQVKATPSPKKILSPANAGDQWGWDVASLGAFDPNDAVPDLAVGAHVYDAGGTNAGSVWLLHLNADGTQKGAATEISAATDASLAKLLEEGDNLGVGLAMAPDLDGDGLAELLVGAGQDDDGGADKGAVYLLYLDASGGVKQWDKYSDTRGCLAADLPEDDGFGRRGIAFLGDLSGDETPEIAVGADLGDFNTSPGAIHILSLEQPAQTATHQLVCGSIEIEIANMPNVHPVLRQNVDPFSVSVAPSGDFTLPYGNFGPTTGATPTGTALTSVVYSPLELSTLAASPVSGSASSQTLPLNGRTVARGAGKRWVGGVGLLRLELLGGLVKVPLYGLGPEGMLGLPGQWTRGLVSTVDFAEGANVGWFTGTASAIGRFTTPSASNTLRRSGLDARTPSQAGHLQLVTASMVDSAPVTPNEFGLFATLNLTFVPEPASLLGLVSGAGLLALLAWRRRHN